MSLILLTIVFGVLSVVFMIMGLRKLKKEVEGAKYELETEKPVSLVYKFLLKTYSNIQNLNILNMVENKSIETELRQVGVGYYTTTHYYSGSSGSGQSYTSTQPYTYMIRYNALIQFENKNGKSLIKMNLKTGKLGVNSIIMSIMFIIMAVFMGVMFSFIPFIRYFWILPVFILISMSLFMNIIIPRSTLNNYRRTAEDQFQLLVKKPIISIQIGTDDETPALQILPVEKGEARYKKTERICPYCGKVVSELAQICENCGSEIN
ncbi:MAG: zinc ribbon domain-containing protein [Candidatus Hermodarchaeota archaeon]